MTSSNLNLTLNLNLVKARKDTLPENIFDAFFFFFHIRSQKALKALLAIECFLKSGSTATLKM
jgi:hypothetical protein